MAKAIIVYGSTTGTTEAMSQTVARTIESAGVDVVVKKASDSPPEEISNYDLIILGCSTWGDGELQDDFIAFEEKLRSQSLKDRKGVVFGPGETMYPQFCKAVDILEDTLRKCGADVPVKGLKIDVTGGDYEEAVSAWAKSVAEALS